jgi:dTDP-4-amino-4,6-dideoxygalactose transaminase
MIDFIPFNDLNRQYQSIKKEIDVAIEEVIRQSAFIRGPYVETFEKEFANLNQVKHCISCANGTDALYIALKALELKKDQEVIVPANTWISTSETVTQAGGKVIFCDVDPKTYCISIEDIKKKITNKTVGIIPVHLFGHPSDMDKIIDIAQKHNMWIIEDCAQAHLAKYKGKMVGTFGIIATYSFYPGKNLGAMGDAGAIVTNDDSLNLQMQMFARHGGLKKGEHKIEGINSRMDGLQAAILSVKLKKIHEWTEKRKEIANRYLENIKNKKNISIPKISEYVSHVWHLFVIESDRREELRTYLKSNGIETAINYPIALPFTEAYSYLKHKYQDFQVAYEKQKKILSIPIFPDMHETEQKYVIDILNSFE